MRNETNKRNLFIAIGLGLLFILIPNTGISSKSFIVNQNFIISLIIYTILCYLALYCYSSNKIAGIVLLISISFISPNFYNIKTEDDKTITYKKGNMPTGPIGKELKPRTAAITA